MSLNTLTETMIETMNRQTTRTMDDMSRLAASGAHPFGAAMAMSAASVAMLGQMSSLYWDGVARAMRGAGAQPFATGFWFDGRDMVMEAASEAARHVMDMAPEHEAKRAAALSDDEIDVVEAGNSVARAGMDSGPANASLPVTAAPNVGLQPEDFIQPRTMAKPEMRDDLKRISGVGPKLEQVLNGLGIWTFAQIADWSPNEIAWVDDYLGFKGRIARDNWLFQAAELRKAAKA
jgi:NADH-quinone oxidoreductase subunit E